MGIVGWNCEHISSVGNSISGPSSNNDVETMISVETIIMFFYAAEYETKSYSYSMSLLSFSLLTDGTSWLNFCIEYFYFPIKLPIDRDSWIETKDDNV